MSLETYWLITPIFLLGLSGLGWLCLWVVPRRHAPATAEGALSPSETEPTQAGSANLPDSAPHTVRNSVAEPYRRITFDATARFDARDAWLDSERAAEAIDWLEKQTSLLGSERAELWERIEGYGWSEASRRDNSDHIRLLKDRVARLDSRRAKLREQIADRAAEVSRWLEILSTQLEWERANVRESIERLTPKSGERGDADVISSLETRAARLDAERADLRDKIEQLAKRLNAVADEPQPSRE